MPFRDRLTTAPSRRTPRRARAAGACSPALLTAVAVAAGPARRPAPRRRPRSRCSSPRTTCPPAPCVGDRRRTHGRVRARLGPGRPGPRPRRPHPGGAAARRRAADRRTPGRAGARPTATPGWWRCRCGCPTPAWPGCCASATGSTWSPPTRRARSAETVAADVPVLALPDTPTEVGAAGLAGRLVVVGVQPGEVARIADASVRTFVTIAFAD